MQTFTGKEYLAIAAANAYGLDQEDWDARILIGQELLDVYKLEDFDSLGAKEPTLLKKAWFAYQETKEGKPTGYIMNLDATASGPQLIACMMGCEKTARATNVIDKGFREDLYRFQAQNMNNLIGEPKYERDGIKTPVMTTFYGSKQEPKNYFEPQELEIYYDMLEETVPGCMEYLETTIEVWQSNQEFHSWTLPDNHVAKIAATELVDHKIEVDELGGASFTMREEEIVLRKRWHSLAAHIVQSMDAYVARQIVQRASNRGFMVLCIHDSFWTHPNYMNQLRSLYNEILAEICEHDYLGAILTEISGQKYSVDKPMKDMAKYVLKANYTLS